MGVLYANNAIGRLSAGIDTDDTTLTLLAGEGAKFPAITTDSGDWYPCTLVNVAGQREIVRVTARNGDVFTIARAQEGSGALEWLDQDRFELRVTAAAYQQLVPSSRKVNSKALSADITLNAEDVGALPYADGDVSVPVALLNLTGLFTSSSSQPLDIGCLGGVPGDFLIDIHTDGTETGEEFKYRITFKNDGSGVNLGSQIEGTYVGSNGFADQYNTLAAFHQTVTSKGTSEYWPVWKQRVVTGQYDEIKWVSSMGWLLGSLDWVLQLRPETVDEANGVVERLFSFMRDGSFLLPATPAAEDNSNKAATTAFVATKLAALHSFTPQAGSSVPRNVDVTNTYGVPISVTVWIYELSYNTNSNVPLDAYVGGVHVGQITFKKDNSGEYDDRQSVALTFFVPVGVVYRINVHDAIVYSSVIYK